MHARFSNMLKEREIEMQVLEFMNICNFFWGFRDLLLIPLYIVEKITDQKMKFLTKLKHSKNIFLMLNLKIFS